MRIGLISTVATPVRPEGAGSIESLVYVIARELVERGHEVTVFATATSSPPCELVSVLAGPYAHEDAPDDWQLCEAMNAGRALSESHRFDVLHSHSYLNAVPAAGAARCPVVHTTHVLPYDDEARLRQAFPDAPVTALSRFQWSRYPHLPPARVIPHGVEPAAHTFRAEPDDHILFLGRLIAGKGPLDAVEAARRVDLPLWLAGPTSDHFTAAIEPHVDGELIRWLGPVGGVLRDELLGGARVLAYPVRDPEPFGLVMLEAMMSGTPVAAYGIGAVPEIVDDGVTGAIVPPGGDIAEGVRRCLALDRHAVRRRAVERFSSSRMVDRYEALYESLAVEVAA